MVDLEDESDAAVRRRIEAELAEGRQPSAVLRGLVEDGAERERAARLVSEVLEPPEPEPASDDSAPQRGGLSWMVLAGGLALALGIVSSLVTGRVAYASLLAGSVGIVVGLMRGGAPRRSLSDRLSLFLVLGFGVVAAAVVLILIRRSEREPSPAVYDPLAFPAPAFGGAAPEPSASMAHEGCTGVTFSPQGTLLATLGGNTVRVWTVATRSELHALEVGFEPEQVIFVDDSRALVALSDSGKMKRFDLQNGGSSEDVPSTPWQDEVPGGVPALLPDGDELVIGGDSPSLWSLSKQKRLGRYSGAPGYCSELSASAEHVAAWCDGTLVVWKSNKPRPLAKLRLESVRDLAISPAGKYVSTLSWHVDGKDSRHRYDVFELETLEKRFSLEALDADDFKADFSFSADDRRLALRQTAEAVVIVDPQTGRRVREQKVPAWGFDLDLSPDGSLLALSAAEIELMQVGDAPARAADTANTVAPAIEVPWKLPDREMTQRERALMGIWIAKLDAHGTELPMLAGGAIFDMKNRQRDVLGLAEAVIADKRIPTGCVWMELGEGFRGRRDPCALQNGEPAALETSNLMTGEKTDIGVPLEWYLDGDTIKIHAESELVVIATGDAGKRKLRFRHWHLEMLDDDTMKETVPEHDYTLPGRYRYQIYERRDAGGGR